jgi:hypothetical protein
MLVGFGSAQIQDLSSIMYPPYKWQGTYGEGQIELRFFETNYNHHHQRNLKAEANYTHFTGCRGSFQLEGTARPYHWDEQVIKDMIDVQWKNHEFNPMMRRQVWETIEKVESIPAFQANPSEYLHQWDTARGFEENSDFPTMDVARLILGNYLHPFLSPPPKLFLDLHPQTNWDWSSCLIPFFHFSIRAEIHPDDDQFYGTARYYILGSTRTYEIIRRTRS